ncbi:MAG: polya polymerase [Lachnospiraceae bacterium]|nr:polya polymerase [Lachnospiraceae bacterium]
MKIKKNINVEAFLENVRKCEGNVYFKTLEGDMLNLKSLLSQYILMSIIDNDELMGNGVIDCSMESDVVLLGQYLE